MKKYLKFLSLVVFVGAFILTLAVQGEIQAKNINNPEVVTIGYQVGADDKDLVKAKSWFETDLAKQGIKLKYAQFNAGRDINNAMIAKAIDFGDMGDPPVAIGVSRGIAYEVYWLHNIIAESEALAVKNNANINSLADLKGKKIATTISSTAHYSLLSALKFAGVDAKDVKIIDLNPADIVAAWQRGDIDAAYTWQPNLSKLVNDGGKVLITSRELAAKGAPTSNIGVVRKEFAEKYPRIVSLYVKELIRAYNEYKNNPSGTAETLAKALEIDKAEAAKQAKEYIWLTGNEQITSRYLGTSPKKGDFAKGLKAIADFLVEQKALDSAADLATFEKVLNSKYIEDALKK